MTDSYYPGVDQLLLQQRTRHRAIFLGLLATVVIIFGAMAAIVYLSGRTGDLAIFLAGLGILALLAIPAVIWMQPRAGIYIIFAGSTLFEDFWKAETLKIPTMDVPFFWNISTAAKRFTSTNALNPLSFSLAEVSIVLTLLFWIVRSVAARDVKFQTGGFLGWTAAYIAMVTFGFVHGLTTGADTTMALYEVRAQFHYLVVYVLACNLFQTRAQVLPLVWILVIGSGVKGFISAVSYYVSNVEVGDQGFLRHEESLFFDMIFFVFIIALVLNVNRKLIYTALAFCPTALLTIFFNKRRAGIAAFIVAFVPLLPLLYVVVKERRKQLGAFLVIFAMAMAVYMPAAWNASGMWALPARAIRSASDPSARDQASDQYRMAEDYDLKATRDQSPWIGLGYGKEFYQPVPLPETNTGFVHFMPHNSVLWIWMRLGHFGFFCFLLMIYTVLVKGACKLKYIEDPMLRLMGILAIVVVLVVFCAGKYDLAFTSYRLMALMATLVGMLGVLDQIDAREKERKALASES